jgi:hypothetical protein
MTIPSGKGQPTPDNPEALARAVRKVIDGKSNDLTREERDALKQNEKQKEERLRWQYYETIPQKHWRQMSGRQSKVINEQAERYGIPFGGSTISLTQVVRAIHNFLADNKYKLAREDDALMNGSSSPALERYREERAAMAQMDRLEREGNLISRDVVRISLGKTASIIRTAGEALQRQFGQAAADILNEAIDDAEAEIDRFFTPSQEVASDDPPD